MKQTIGLLAFLLAASGIVCSCDNHKIENYGALEFDSLTVNRTVHLFGDSARPACNLVIHFAYAASANDPRLKDSLNHLFQVACFGESYATATPEETVESYAGQYAANYRHDLEPMYLKDEQESGDKSSMESWYSYYQTIESRVMECVPLLLTYRIDRSEYTGGAHGLYSTTYLNINLQTLRPFRLDELFTGNYRQPLTDLLWKRLMADNHVATRQELEDMGFGTTGDLEPIENFYLTPAGITFHYNVYDIAPYVMGSTTISLPYREITSLMSEDLLTLSNILKTER